MGRYPRIPKPQNLTVDGIIKKSDIIAKNCRDIQIIE